MAAPGPSRLDARFPNGGRPVKLPRVVREVVRVALHDVVAHLFTSRTSTISKVLVPLSVPLVQEKFPAIARLPLGRPGKGGRKRAGSRCPEFAAARQRCSRTAGRRARSGRPERDGRGARHTCHALTSTPDSYVLSTHPHTVLCRNRGNLPRLDARICSIQGVNIARGGSVEL